MFTTNRAVAKFILLLFCGMSLTTFNYAQNIIYVDIDNTNSVKDGSSWATAYTDIQEALIASLNAVGADEIWIAEGTYTPVTCTSNCTTDEMRGKTFQLLKGVSLFGGFKGNEANKFDRNPWANKTILSGDLLGNDNPNDLRKNAPSRLDNSNHVITGDLVDNTSVLDGFIVTGGNASSDILNTQSGGGMVNNAGSPIIRNCIFEYNTATAAGALDCSNKSNPIVINCIFRNNVASDLGGAISVFQESNPVFMNCLFHHNEAGQTGGASYSGDNGTGAETVVTFNNCTFFGNTSVDVGPTHAGQLNSTAIFSNSILWKNTRNGSFSPQIKLSDSAKVEVSYSIVQTADTSTYPGVGNLNSDPDFYDELTSDFRINVGSPAVNAGGVMPMDLGDIDQDSITEEPLPIDLRGVARVYTGDEGVIDMGAYENTGFPDGIFNPISQDGLNVLVAPNPANNRYFGITVSQAKGHNLEISLLDLNGKILYGENLRIFNSEEIKHNIRHQKLSTGIYLLSVKTDTQHHVRKVVVR